MTPASIPTNLIRCGLLACALLAFGCSDSTDAGSPFPPATVAELDDRVEALLAQGMSAGAMVTVTTPAGTLTRTYGVADTATGAPMDDALLFRVGSVTKTFTVTVLLQLVDEKRIGLDDTIGSYLDGVPYGDQVTLRMMAGMTSGLPSYTASPAFQTAVSSDWSRDWAPQELLVYAWEQDQLFPPGTNFFYSNSNTVLLGLLIEKLEQKPIGAVFRERIFDRLGLTDTSWPEDASFPGPYVHGYSTFNPQGTLQDASGWSPSEAFTAGEIISTLSDLRIWVRVLALGELLKPATQAQRLDWAHVGPNAPDRFYALGIFGIDGWLGHDGDIPGWTTFAMYNPTLDASIVVTANADEKFQGYAPASLLVKTASEVLFPNDVIDNGH